MHLIKKDDKVGASESTLLNMLKISPFSYGLVIQQGTVGLFLLLACWCVTLVYRCDGIISCQKRSIELLFAVRGPQMSVLKFCK